MIDHGCFPDDVRGGHELDDGVAIPFEELPRTPRRSDGGGGGFVDGVKLDPRAAGDSVPIGAPRPTVAMMASARCSLLASAVAAPVRRERP